nr:V-type ATP synthase subunit E [Maliibacterium massiliense]
MSGAQRIIAQIELDAQARAKEIDAQAQVRMAEMDQAIEEQVAQIRQEILAQGKRAADAEEARYASLAQLEVRKIKLEKKQQLVAEVFDGALAYLCHMEKDAYAAFARDLVLEAALAGEQKLVLSPRAAALLDDAWFGMVNVELDLKGKSARVARGGVDESLQGGFLLVRGDMEINLSFEALVSQARGALEGEVVRQLF